MATQPVVPQPAAAAPAEESQATPVAPVAPQRPGQNPVVAEPQQEQERERHTIPPEIPYPAYHMAAAARGGWKRISMSTVQSEDKRFTITHVDPTRRSDWFLLKDLETGQTYDETTMTGAKKKAKELRGDGTDELDEDEGEVTTPDYDYVPPVYSRDMEDNLNTETTYRTAKLAVEDTMAASNTSKWARLRQVAAEEPKEADAAIAEVADALGTMADALSNLRENLDLIEAPKAASIKVRIATARKYAASFRRVADEAPDVVAGAISEVYHSLDDVAGALENLAENLGIELSMSPAQEAFGEEGKLELSGEKPQDSEETEVNEEEFEEGVAELESPKAEEAEEKIEEIDKEAGAQEWVTDRDEEGKPKTPVTAAKKKLPDFLKKDDKEKDEKKKEKKADGSAAFINDRDESGKPNTPEKLDIPEAQGETEVGKAAAKRAELRNRIAKRYGIQL